MFQSTILKPVLVLCFFLLSTFILQANIVPGGTIVATTDAQHKNKIHFSINSRSLPTLPSNGSGQAPSRIYFWDFGDGHYSFDANPSHIYDYQTNSSGPFEVMLRATRIKSDDDIEESTIRVNINCGNPAQCTTALNPLPNTRRNSLRMDANRTPRAGDPIVYILTYKNTCEQTVNGNLLFKYNPSQFTSNVDVRTHHGETINNSQAGYLEIDFSNSNSLAADQQRNVFIALQVAPNIPVNTVIESSVSLDFKSPDGKGLECNNNGEQTLTKRTVRSHDPNQKTVNQAYICPDSNMGVDCKGNKSGRVLFYTIRFQNTGVGAAQNIRIIDQLHSYLDWNNIQYVSSKHPNAYNNQGGRISVASNGEVSFSFQNIGLPGTQQIGYGINFTEEDTWGEITYKVQVKPDLPPCGNILNQAAIVFDNNPPILTTIATTLVRDNECCECETVCENVAPTKKTIRFDRRQRSPLSLVPSIENLPCLEEEFTNPIYQWYPAIGLDDPTILQPKINAPQNARTYSLSIFDSQNEVRVPISEVRIEPSN